MLQDVEHLFELEIRLRCQLDNLAIEIEFRAGTLEVEARVDLTIGLIDAIRRFVRIKVADYIKRRHVPHPLEFCL